MASSRVSFRLRRKLRKVSLGVRQLSAPRRALPDFVIIGAQKAGTTSLFTYLSAHPQVRPSVRKEVHYFDENFARGENWYRAMFPMSRSLRPSEGRRRITGEASPYYLFHPLAAPRAAQLIPDAKLIVLLRDPVSRAWSHYQHEVAAGRETLSFGDALTAEPERLAGASDAIREGRSDPAVGRHRNFSYVSRGMYADQLRTWFEHFPRNAFLILDADLLFKQPESAWLKTTDFLGIDGSRRPKFAVHNRGINAQLDTAMRQRLEAAFRAANQDLETLLDMTFSWTPRPT